MKCYWRSLLHSFVDPSKLIEYCTLYVLYLSTWILHLCPVPVTCTWDMYLCLVPVSCTVGYSHPVICTCSRLYPVVHVPSYIPGYLVVYVPSYIPNCILLSTFPLTTILIVLESGSLQALENQCIQQISTYFLFIFFFCITIISRTIKIFKVFDWRFSLRPHFFRCLPLNSFTWISIQ